MQNGQSGVPVVSYVTNFVPRLIPGAIPASPLIPAGHSVVYYDEVSHGGLDGKANPAAPLPKPDLSQQPDDSQRHETIVQSNDDSQQQHQQAPEAPAVVHVPAPTPAAPVVPVTPVAPAAAVSESSNEDHPESGSEDGSGNDQPAVGVNPSEEPVPEEESPAAAEEDEEENKEASRLRSPSRSASLPAGEDAGMEWNRWEETDVADETREQEYK